MISVPIEFSEKIVKKSIFMDVTLRKDSAHTKCIENCCHREKERCSLSVFAGISESDGLYKPL